MKDKQITILVATHKKYNFPDIDMYVPIHVGKEGKVELGYIGDNTGDNISKKNPNYCELTAMYWAWKNLKTDYIGLCHYRRYFTTSKSLKNRFIKNKFDLVLSEDEAKKILSNFDMIVSEEKNLFFKNVRSKYAQQHFVQDLDQCGDIIKELYPNYYDSYKKVMKNHKMSICNMCIMKKKDYDAYCKWLFDILFEAESKIDISDYSTLQKRIFGFLSERLFNVWLEYHSELKIKKLPILSLEHDSMKVIFNKAYKRIRGIKS